MTGKCAIFIDGGYLIKCLKKEFGGAKIDFDKFSGYIARDTKILRTYFYNCLPFQSDPVTPEESKMFANVQKFHYELKMLPNYEVRLGKLRRWGEDSNYTYKQKMVDVLLSIDLVKLSLKRAFEEAIIVTGDSDFIPAIKVAKDEGIHIKLVHGLYPHGDLVMEVDERQPIDKTMLKAVKA